MSTSVPQPGAKTLTESASILVVDDEEGILAVFRQMLGRQGYTVTTAGNGREALQLLQRRIPDLILSDCMMPEMSGFELCRHLKDAEMTRLVPLVLITGVDDDEARMKGIEAGADDFLRKPVKSQELAARVRSLIRLKRYTDDLDSAEAMILSMAKTVEARDSYTSGHCDRMAHYAAVFGEHLHLSPEQILALRRGGYLHDIGKIGLPDAILQKPGPLTPAEFELMKSHTIVGDELCANLRMLRLVRPIVRQHHERLNGTGYPDGARGDGISLLAQIVGIVDVYDALTTDRPYRGAMAPERAYAELLREVSVGWRAHDLVSEFLTIARAGALTI